MAGEIDTIEEQGTFIIESFSRRNKEITEISLQDKFLLPRMKNASQAITVFWDQLDRLQREASTPDAETDTLFSKVNVLISDFNKTLRDRCQKLLELAKNSDSSMSVDLKGQFVAFSKALSPLNELNFTRDTTTSPNLFSSESSSIGSKSSTGSSSISSASSSNNSPSRSLELYDISPTSSAYANDSNPISSERPFNSNPSRSHELNDISPTSSENSSNSDPSRSIELKGPSALELVKLRLQQPVNTIVELHQLYVDMQSSSFFSSAVPYTIRRDALLFFYAHAMPDKMPIVRANNIGPAAPTFVCPLMSPKGRRTQNGKARKCSTMIFYPFSFGLHALAEHYGLRLNQCYGCPAVFNRLDLNSAVIDHMRHSKKSCVLAAEGLTVDEIYVTKIRKGIKLMPLPTQYVVLKNVQDNQKQQRDDLNDRIKELARITLKNSESSDSQRMLATSALKWLTVGQWYQDLEFHQLYIEALLKKQ